MMAGAILFLMGALRLGQIIRFVPISIVIGFTNGIAVVIMLSQVKDFLGLQIEKMPGQLLLPAGHARPLQRRAELPGPGTGPGHAADPHCLAQAAQGDDVPSDGAGATGAGCGGHGHGQCR